MKGLAVIVNVLAVVIGGSVGSLFRGKYKVRYQHLTLDVVGAAALLLGLLGLLRGMFPFREDVFETEGTLLAVFALIVGTVLGEALGIERMLDALGRTFRSFIEKDGQKPAKPKKPAPAAADGGKKRRSLSELPVYNMESHRSGHRFVDGFVIATLIVCANPMALNGAIADAQGSGTEMLYIKAAVDVILVAALATVYGAGTGFAALPLAVVEGTVLILQSNAVEFMTEKLVGQLAVITSVMLIAEGFSLAFRKKLRPANMLPANLIPVLYYFLTSLAEKGE